MDESRDIKRELTKASNDRVSCNNDILGEMSKMKATLNSVCGALQAAMPDLMQQVRLIAI